MDGWTITALLGACAELGHLMAAKAAHGIARRALRLKSFNSTEVVIGLVGMYAKCGAPQLARKVFDLSGEKAKDVRVWSVMVSGYVRAGELDMARRLFDEMPTKDLVAWTILIAGYVQAGRYNEAFRLFEEMEATGLEADEVTVVILISACVWYGAIDLAKRLHHHVKQNGLISRNARVATSFVRIYAKHGCLQTAMDVFHGVVKESKTVELFNAMIHGLAHHGYGEKAISLFDEMEYLGLHPDGVTFLGVLCACSRSSLVEEGRKIFNSMLDKYGVKPDVKHHACMVDILARSGRIEDAYNFLQYMPFKPNHVVWSSLLTACKIHGNYKIRKLVEKKLLELDTTYKPEKLTLSGLFSDEKRKEIAARVRKVIKHKSGQTHTH